MFVRDQFNHTAVPVTSAISEWNELLLITSSCADQPATALFEISIIVDLLASSLQTSACQAMLVLMPFAKFGMALVAFYVTGWSNCQTSVSIIDLLTCKWCCGMTASRCRWWCKVLTTWRPYKSRVTRHNQIYVRHRRPHLFSLFEPKSLLSHSHCFLSSPHNPYGRPDQPTIPRVSDDDFSPINPQQTYSARNRSRLLKLWLCR